MENQPPASGESRTNKRLLVVVGILGLLIVAVLVAGWYLLFSGHNMAGLEGTWRDPANPRHSHEFLPSGDVETWPGKKGIGLAMFPMPRFATWRRDGQQITVRTDRNWDFVGQLDGGTIRGQMLIRDETGAIVNKTAAVWKKE